MHQSQSHTNLPETFDVFRQYHGHSMSPSFPKSRLLAVQEALDDPRIDRDSGVAEVLVVPNSICIRDTLL